MPESITIRPLRADDFDQWSVLWQGYLHFYRGEVSDAQTRLTFERLCAGGDMAGLVAVDESNGPIGLSHLVYHPATWSENGYCYLEDLYVDRSSRGGATARALLHAVFAHARERQVERVYWHTQQFNGPARSLYDTVAHLTSFVVYERDL
jgi:GNAT superfamily N-acetyltransferase